MVVLQVGTQALVVLFEGLLVSGQSLFQGGTLHGVAVLEHSEVLLRLHIF